MEKFIEKGINHATPGWWLNTKEIRLFLTEDGGMHAPGVFFADTKEPVSPYALTPWQDERPDISFCPLLQNLRGDFFCLPFGDNPTAVDGFTYPPHGETAASRWQEEGVVSEKGRTVFTFGMQTKVNSFRIEKQIEMREGDSAIYLKHIISGLEAKMPYGHHTILVMPEKEERMFFSVGKFDFGMTCSGIFSNPENGEHQYLASGEEFSELEKLPTAFKADPVHDYSLYPSPVGYTDLFSLLKKPGETPAWSVCVYPERGYLFFLLKNCRELPCTTVWVANSGRYGFPWNGNTRCIGVEDTCSFFAKGIQASIEPNDWTRRGWKTCGEFHADTPTAIRQIQGAARIPAGFGKVVAADFLPGKVVFTDAAGKKAEAKVDASFLEP